MTAPMSSRSQQQGTRRAYPMPQQQQQPHHQGEAGTNRNRPTDDGGGRNHQLHQDRQTRTATTANTDHRTRNTQQGGGGGGAPPRRSSDGYHTHPFPNSHHRSVTTNSSRLAMSTPPLRPTQHQQSPSVYPTQRDIHGAEWYTNFPYADKPIEMDLMHEPPSSYGSRGGGRGNNSQHHHQQNASSGTQQTPAPPKVNYCRHYLLGKCNRGTMCRFPHLEQHSVVVRHSRVARGLQDTSCATACSSLDNDQGRHSSVSPPLFALEDPGIVEATDEVDFFLPPPAMTSSSTNCHPYEMSHVDQRNYFQCVRFSEETESPFFNTLYDGASRGSTTPPPPPPPPVYQQPITDSTAATSSATKKRSHQPYTAPVVAVSCCNVVRHDPYTTHISTDLNDSATGALQQFFEGFDDDCNGRDTCARDDDNESGVEEHCCGASNTPEHYDHHNHAQQQRCGSRHSYDHSLASATPRTEPSSAHPTPCDVVQHSFQRSDTQQFVDEHHSTESPAWMFHSAPASAHVSPSLAYQQQPLVTNRDEIDYLCLPPAATHFSGSSASLAPTSYFEHPVTSQSQFSSSRPSTAPMPSQRTMSNGSLTAYPMTSRTAFTTANRFAAAQQQHQPPQTTRSAAITPEEAAILKNLW